MTIVTADSPWYILAVSHVMFGNRPPGTFPIPYQEWIRWRRYFTTFRTPDDSLAVVQGAINDLVLQSKVLA